MIQPLRARLREATHDAILQAAEQVFSQAGIHAGRMDDIAAQAGVSVGTLYSYFKDRDHLLASLLTARKKSLVTRLDDLYHRASGAPFEELLSQTIFEFLEHFERHRSFFSLITQGELAGQSVRPEDPTHSSQTVLEELRSCIRRIMARGTDSGLLDPSMRELYPALFLGMVRAAIFQSVLSEKPLDLRLRTEQLTRFFLHGGSVSHG